VGREEFAVLLPDTGAEAARIVSEKLRLAVQENRIWFGGSEIQVTSSFGVAPFKKEMGGAESLFRKVDQALYRAKESGKNCVIMAD